MKSGFKALATGIFVIAFCSNVQPARYFEPVQMQMQPEILQSVEDVEIAQPMVSSEQIAEIVEVVAPAVEAAINEAEAKEQRESFGSRIKRYGSRAKAAFHSQPKAAKITEGVIAGVAAAAALAALGGVGVGLYKGESYISNEEKRVAKTGKYPSVEDDWKKQLKDAAGHARVSEEEFLKANPEYAVTKGAIRRQSAKAGAKIPFQIVGGAIQAGLDELRSKKPVGGGSSSGK